MLLLRTTGLEHVVPIVRDNLELIALYRQIKSNLGRNEEYRIFAEPSIDRFKKQISWYTEYGKSFLLCGLFSHPVHRKFRTK